MRGTCSRTSFRSGSRCSRPGSPDAPRRRRRASATKGSRYSRPWPTVTLVAVSIWIFVEALSRLREPPEILGSPMLAIAGVGLLVNVAGAIVLSRSVGESLNMQGALRHVIADALGSLGTIAAALSIVLAGWRYADPIASLAIAALILASSWSLLRGSTNVLLEAAPAG